MQTITETIEVDVPLRTAYDQWTQFESFPEFMDEVEQVEQLTDAELRWTTQIAGKRDTFTTRIVDQQPDSHIAWSTLRGEVEHSGRVDFRALDDDRTQLTVQLQHDPQGGLEKLGSMLGLDDHAVRKDLDNFKEFIEERGQATGAWRGTIQNGSVTVVDADNPRSFRTSSLTTG